MRTTGLDTWQHSVATFLVFIPENKFFLPNIEFVRFQPQFGVICSHTILPSAPQHLLKGYKCVVLVHSNPRALHPHTSNFHLLFQHCECKRFLIRRPRVEVHVVCFGLHAPQRKKLDCVSDLCVNYLMDI